MTAGRRPEVVVVTGASAGVGRAVVRRFASDGARIGLLARGPDGLEAARREIEERGGQAHAVPTDVSDAAEVERAAASVEEAFGPIDTWVNDAMVSVFSPFREMTAGEFRRVTEVTYLGCVYGTMAALRRMLPRDRGTVVQVGSALAHRSIPLQSAYCGAKHAIKGFTESIRCELIHERSRVHITEVDLPALNTPQFGWVRSRLPREPQPVPPIFQPEVAAEAIVWAARHRRRRMSVGWPTVKAILGEKLVPAYADRRLAYDAWDGQMTDQPARPGRRDNLEAPVPGDHGAHGAFDHRASAWSWQLWANTNRGLVAAAGAIVLAGVLKGLAGDRDGRPRLAPR